MKTRLVISLSFCLAVPLYAQAPVPAAAPVRTPDQLEELLAPIALYPDPLLAMILPAATVPADVVLAARYLGDGGDPNQTADQPWDDSVKALAHYPDIVKWMDQNLEWTRSVGAAFLTQQQDVMAAIQRLRAEARVAGNLVNTPQQQIVMDGDEISIMPAQPNVIYVPVYNPQVVYFQAATAFPGPLVVFGPGWAVGAWLGYDCDWHQRSVWITDWHPGWGDRTGWGQPWRPNPNRPPPHPVIYRTDRDLPRPRPMPTAPAGHQTGPKRSGPPENVTRPARPEATGWGSIPNQRTKTAPPVNRPAAAPAPERPPNAFSGSDQGGAARAASARGNASWQTVHQPAQRPAAPAPRPEPRPEKPAFQPAPARPPPANQQPSAFGNVNSGAAARTDSARGANSRNRKN